MPDPPAQPTLYDVLLMHATMSNTLGLAEVTEQEGGPMARNSSPFDYPECLGERSGKPLPPAQTQSQASPGKTEHGLQRNTISRALLSNQTPLMLLKLYTPLTKCLIPLRWAGREKIAREYVLLHDCSTGQATRHDRLLRMRDDNAHPVVGPLTRAR
jgi:hypothetical protein